MPDNINMRNITEEQQLSVIEKDNPELKALMQLYPKEAYGKLLSNKKKLTAICEIFSGSMTTYTSTNAMVMNCTESCPFRDVCILKKNDLAPLGHPCPVEKKMVMELEHDIAKSLGIDKSDPIEMELLWDLIDTKLLDMRASGALKDGTLIQIVENKVGAATSSREEVSPNLEMKMELKKMKHSIIDAFVATRRAKKKYGMQNDVSSIEQMILLAANNVKKDT